MILCFSHDRSSQVLSGVALLSYRAANVPKDKEHPYGSRATLILLFHSYPLYYIHTYIHFSFPQVMVNLKLLEPLESLPCFWLLAVVLRGMLFTFYLYALFFTHTTLSFLHFPSFFCQLPTRFAILNYLCVYELVLRLISSSLFFSFLQAALSSAPELLHGDHSHGGHHHGIDMSHPILALTVTVASISIKEGYKPYFIITFFS